MEDNPPRLYAGALWESGFWLADVLWRICANLYWTRCSRSVWDWRHRKIHSLYDCRRSVHRATRQPCLYGAGCRDQSADSGTVAFDSCGLQHCLSAEAILKQHHQACGEDSKAIFLGYRAGGLPYPLEYAGCSEKRRYGRRFLWEFRDFRDH